MAAVGSLQFCSSCGNLLPSPTTAKRKPITCTVCQTSNKDLTARSILTVSKPSDFPSTLRSKLSQVRSVREEDVQTHAMSSIACDQCGVKEVRYTTAQLRSADEGTTVFYSCDACGHKHVGLCSSGWRLCVCADRRTDGARTIRIAQSGAGTRRFWSGCRR